jgi:hypothetical protein
MRDGQTDVVLLWETLAMGEQNPLVSAGSALAGSTLASSAPALNTPPLQTVHILLKWRNSHHSRNLPAVIFRQSASAVSVWISTWVGYQKKKSQKEVLKCFFLVDSESQSIDRSGCTEQLPVRPMKLCFVMTQSTEKEVETRCDCCLWHFREWGMSIHS